MSVIVMDVGFLTKLAAAGGAAELRDEHGRVLGRIDVGPDHPSLFESAEPDLTEEEIARLNDPSLPTYTTEEVLAEAKRRRPC